MKIFQRFIPVEINFRQPANILTKLIRDQVANRKITIDITPIIFIQFKKVVPFLGVNFN